MRALLVSLAALAGCATPISDEGRMVRQIQNDWAAQCAFLGVVEARGSMLWDSNENRRHALNVLRNQVAALGGNAFSLSQHDVSTLGAATAQGNAYRCPVVLLQRP